MLWLCGSQPGPDQALSLPQQAACLAWHSCPPHYLLQLRCCCQSRRKVTQASKETCITASKPVLCRLPFLESCVVFAMPFRVAHGHQANKQKRGTTTNNKEAANSSGRLVVRGALEFEGTKNVGSQPIDQDDKERARSIARQGISTKCRLKLSKGCGSDWTPCLETTRKSGTASLMALRLICTGMPLVWTRPSGPRARFPGVPQSRWPVLQSQRQNRLSSAPKLNMSRSTGRRQGGTADKHHRIPKAACVCVCVCLRALVCACLCAFFCGHE